MHQLLHGAIWDEFSEQIGANYVEILCIFGLGPKSDFL